MEQRTPTNIGPPGRDGEKMRQRRQALARPYYPCHRARECRAEITTGTVGTIVNAPKFRLRGFCVEKQFDFESNRTLGFTPQWPSFLEFGYRYLLNRCT